MIVFFLRQLSFMCKTVMFTQCALSYQCRFAAMIFENCSTDPRTGNTLISPEFTLLSDQQLTFTMLSVPSSNHSTISVYKTSVLGHIDTNLGSSSVRNNSRSNISAVENFTTDICLPAGTYRLVFIASEVENVIKSTAVLTKVYLSDSPCTYTALTGNRRLYVFSL